MGRVALTPMGRVILSGITLWGLSVGSTDVEDGKTGSQNT